MWLQPPSFFGLPAAADGADICLFGAPFDGTSSGLSGSRFAPRAVREVADFLEVYSPLQDRCIDEINAIDIGDLSLPIGNTEQALSQIRAASEAIVQAGQRPVMIGGEHLCTLPVIETLLTKYPDLVVLQFDAHTDLRDAYLGQILSHATVMRRVLDQLGDPQRLISYGLRSGLREEFQTAKTCRMSGPPHGQIHQRLAGLRFHLEAVRHRPLYLTFDLDVFDPSLLPGTGTPEPGGINFEEFAQIVPLLQDLHLVGLDMVELCPPASSSVASAILAAKVLRELMLALAAATSPEGAPA